MKIISINAGSSSLKFSLFDMDDKKVIASGLFERIGIDGSSYTIKYNGEKIKTEAELATHTDAVKILLDKLVSLNIIKSLDEIDGVGHRLVHGKDKYKASCLITDEVVNDLIAFKDFAPLHNPANVLGIQAFKEVLPDVPMVGVFDTAFHQTMDEESYLYPVPYSWYKEHGVRKYGFHGTSHRYIAKTISEKLGRDDLRIISCHVGNGGSITAIKDGKCVDTSMGFTPLAGIMMGTRSGDVDPSIITYIMEQEGLNAKEVIDILNKKSGLLGLSEISSDMRDIVSAMESDDEQGKKARRAFLKYTRTVTNYIAQYYVLLGGADVICFTAGLGENSEPFRKKVCENLACLGVKLDAEANKVMGEFKKISSDDSTIPVYVVPTDEELMIALDTLKLIS
ncbi:MAG TPA: acetate kinase [Candidatus Onthousia excrementipullorum]|uniref:Acetate kinase n=1 Tax=Candidatus Onthousia excrementipullorum TaxID=2840884 RepID=A0A9D1DU68_9FIRM|nr:acetate kinase [Candidatus Onthousia excrementipullorum]